MDQNIRILILEDRTSDADLVEFELMEAGLVFTPKRTVNEKEFRQALEEFSPDLILSDFDLTQYNGALALFEAKKRYPDIPFILVTGILNTEENGDLVREFTARGVSDFVSKNHLDRLAPAVKKALRMGDVL